MSDNREQTTRERVNREQKEPEQTERKQADREQTAQAQTKPEQAERKQTDQKTAEGSAAATKEKARSAAKATAKKPRPRRASRKKKEEEPPEPSPKQPILDGYVATIKEALGEDVVEEAVINRPNNHVPTIRVQREQWLEVAQLLKSNPELAFDYLSDLTAYDDDDFMAVVVHVYSFTTQASLAVHIRTERDPAWVPSVTSVWKAANWNEREMYDLFGIEFRGHPNLTRIMLPDDWVGHPLRKDYVPLDEEV